MKGRGNVMIGEDGAEVVSQVRACRICNRGTSENFLMKFAAHTVDDLGVAGYTRLSCEKSDVKKW